MWQFSNGFNVDVKFVVLDSILLLFVFIGPVILNQWFQIRVAQWTSCRHVEHHIGTWARSRHDQARVKAVLSILHFCHWHFLCSCGLVASLSMMLKEALCLQKSSDCSETFFSESTAEDITAMTHKGSLLLSPLLCKVIYSSKKL